MKKNLLAAAAVLIGTVLTGCGPAYVGAYIGPPPPPRYGVMGFAPGPGYVWTDGYYNLVGSSWVWVGGRWMRPPHPGAAWVAPAWRREGSRYRFHRGYWR